MKAKHSVKIDGKFYKAGEEISPANTFNYSKTEINRMPVAELKKLGEELGILGFENMTGTELKKEIISKL